jgi:hypothetical protein
MLNPWLIDPDEVPQREGAAPEARLEQLKRDIALARYEVDAASIAEAIVTKLELLRRGRAAIRGGEADRIQSPTRHRLQAS